MLRAGLRSTTIQLYKLRHQPLSNVRQFGSRSNGSHLTRRAVARTTLLALTAAASTVYFSPSLHADSDAEPRDTAPSLGSLVRAYAVYSMCSVPALVDASPKILSTLSAIPGIKQLTEAFVRVTFFDQFVGADSAEEAIPLLYSLRAANKGVLFAYSVEVDENEATGASFSSSSAESALDSSTSFSASSNKPTDNMPKHKNIVDEMVHCIDVAAGFEEEISKKNINSDRRTWVAVKMTALLPDAHALIALSSHIVESRKNLSQPEASVPFPGAARLDDLDILTQESSSPSPLTPAQKRHLRDLYADLHRVCAQAREKGVKVIVDAEYSWYQPAIDALTLALMREFNTLDPKKAAGEVQPLVYGTFQAYLRRTPQQLALALENAKKNNYALGVKLVRGAYHPHELAAHQAALAFDQAHPSPTTTPRPCLSISPDPKPPVWETKKDTDDAYNSCVRLLIKAVKEDLTRPIDTPSSSFAPAATSRIVSKRDWVAGYLGLGSKNDVQTSITQSNTTAAQTTTPTPRIGILFGTHNWDSCALILLELLRNGLAVEDASRPIRDDKDSTKAIRVGREIVERVAIGQLYGMSDDLTEWVVSRISSTTPFVIKYVPYGALADVMPYLGRRAIENKSVLGDGNALHERKRARLEIQKRIFGGH